MRDDVPMACGDVFGTGDLQDRLKAFCKEQGLEMPRFRIFPPNGVYINYAVSLHLTGKDRWEEFDANIVYLLKDLKEIGHNEALANRLCCMFEDLGEPVVLTVKADESNSHQCFFKGLGMTRLPVTWSDENQQDYEVYTKGFIEMGGFVNLMERVGYIGKEIIFKEADGK
jgi:hypothetical protein